MRTKYRPTRKWVDTSIKLVIGRTGTAFQRVPAGERPDGIVCFTMPDNQIRKGNVLRQNTRIAVTLILPDYRENESKTKASRFKRCCDRIRHLVREHKGEDMTMEKEPLADGQIRWHVRCRMLTNKAVAFQACWTGNVHLECSF